jgi:hypothetical protein
MSTYLGGCHCGAVRYEVSGDFAKAMECNCSHCSKKGFLLAFVPSGDFTLVQGENNLPEYRFNKKHIAHLFCKTRGAQSFGRGQQRDVDGIDPSTLKITKVHRKDL